MKVYMTKTWGFRSPAGPLQFSQRGWRDRARQILEAGDLVAIVGTMGDETDPEERGKILGLVEPSGEVVNSLDYYLAKRGHDFDDNGNYRWPFGLELRSAWRFLEPRRTLKKISIRKFNMDSAQGIVALHTEEAAKVLTLPREPVGLLRPIQTSARIEGVEAALRKAAPPPTTTRKGTMHIRRAPAFTYAMALEGTSQAAFKIGWAFDWKLRERHFNQASLPSLGGVRYRTMLYQMWSSASEAFRMERALLRSFDSLRHPYNIEVIAPIDKHTLQDAWVRYIKDS